MKTILLGRINIHVTAFVVSDDTPIKAVIDRHDRMVEVRDPKLAEMTETFQFAWSEEPKVKELARNHVLQKILEFFTHLTGRGKFTAPPPPVAPSKIVGLNGKPFDLPPEKKKEDGAVCAHGMWLGEHCPKCDG